MLDKLRACGRRSILSTTAAAVVGVTGRERDVAAQGDPVLFRQAAAWQSASLMTPDGRLSSVGATRKPLTFINVWAYWCAPCLAEFDSIVRMVEILGPSAIEVMLVSLPPNWLQDRTFAAQHRISFSLFTFAPTMRLTDIQAAVRDNGVRVEGIPQTLVFSGKRRRLRLFALGGRDWASPSSVEAIQDIARNPA